MVTVYLLIPTTICTFNLPLNKSLPTDFKMGIGNGTPAGTCTVGANNLVTCTGVPTGSQIGIQPINGQIGNGDVTPTGENVNVVVNATVLPRTGGIEITTIVGIIGAIVLGYISFIGYKRATKKLI